PAAGGGERDRLVPSWRLLLLAFLAANDFVVVLDALALIGLGRAIGADLRGDLADSLPVGAADRDQGRPLAGDLDVLGDRIGDFVAVAELQVQYPPLHRGAITDPVDLQRAGKSGRDAGHHI